ncbi:hypothetical protein ACO22_08170, partial [Paracoccidioides brasiliensis]
MLHSSPPGTTLRNDCCHPPNRPPPRSVCTPHLPEPEPAPAPAPAPHPHPHPPSTTTQIYTPANLHGNGPSHLLSAYLAPSQPIKDARSGPGSRTTLPLTIPPLASMAGHSNPSLQRNRNGWSAVYEEDVDVDVNMADADDVDAGVAATDGENAFFILLRLSFVVPPFSLFAALYTLFTLLFLLLTSPLRLCPPNRGPFFKHPFSTQISSLLLPLLHSHQRLIDPHRIVPSHPHLHSGGRRYKKRHRHDIDYRQKPATTTDMHHPPGPSASIPCFPPPPPPTPAHPHPHPHPHPLQQQQQTLPSIHSHSHSHFPTLLVLVLIHLLSPFLLAPLLLATWIASFFWVFAMIVGNPDGTERRDDGRVAVLG